MLLASSRVLWATFALGLVQFLPAQVCRLSVAGLNRARRVTGQVHAECPGDVVHTAPFGNWGVTSNFGQKRDSHQFDGWCHDTPVCDNGGHCWTDCQDGWYEWNSCTDDPLYKPPNCSLYNAAGCTEQITTTAVNVHGTKYVDVPVQCPADTNGDGMLDAGGCNEVSQYTSGTNFLSLYELDPVCCDQLVQTVYYPSASVKLSCDGLGCAPASSDWMPPVSWDSPSSPEKVTAEMAVVVNWGGFVDSNGACRITSALLQPVSAASYIGPNLAPDSVATVFGTTLAPVTASASASPLPTSLGGITVSITDAAGVERPAGLYFASANQVNFVVPPDTSSGRATVSIFSGETLRSAGAAPIEPVAPALFSAAASGNGVAAANLQRIHGDGSVSVEPIFTCSAAATCTPRLLEIGPDPESDYLTLYGTGIRTGGSPITNVAVTIGGVRAEVTYAGAQPEYPGLDQVNVRVPPELRGSGVVDVVLTVASKPANIVQVGFR